MSAPVIDVRRLSKHFVRSGGPPWKRRRRVVKAVDDVSFALHEDRVVGLVGESGCGKTTVANLIVNLLPPTSGEVRYRGTSVQQMTRDEDRAFRRRAQIVFQDPYASLDPRLTLTEIVTEGYDIHGLYTPVERRERAAQLLVLVGLDADHGDRYPHELSGGQRQRVAIARALSLDSEVLIADEPTSALDVSVKAQIINLLEELRERIGLSMIFVSHDLSVVRHISDEIIVMYQGQVVEAAPTDALFAEPLHPYTRVLLEAIPVPDPRQRRRRALRQEQHQQTAQALLGPEYRLAPDRPGQDAVLAEVRPGHQVRCYPS